VTSQLVDAFQMPAQGGRPTVKARFSGIKNVFGGLSGLSNQPANSSGAINHPANDETDEVVERLTCEELVLTKVGRYGFPYQATCLAVDPLQKILAIGTAHGAIRFCGRPGVECHVRHPTSAAVVQLLFLVNEGGLISACDDASIHIWNLRQAQPALIQSLKFNRERITCLRIPYTSRWLYVGTERGNVYMVCVESFVISGYVINWNKAIPLSCKSHPGPVVEIDSNPSDNSKLLLTFESGECVLWDLRSKSVQERYTSSEMSQQITSTFWHFEGKQFMTGHWDGSISVWNYRNPKKPEEASYPHGGKPGSSAVCCPITKLSWLGVKEGDPCLVIFSGGLAQGNNKKGLTLMRGRSKMLLLSDFVVDFVCIVDTPWQQDYQNPGVVIALLKNEIVVFDLSTLPAPSLPWFDIPYTFGIHESPVTCVQYYPECPADLIPALHRFSQLGKKAAPHGSAKQKWPITGGEVGESTCEPALLVTGHADGSCKFWDVSSTTLYLVYHLKVSQLYSVTASESSSSIHSKGSGDQHNDEPFAIQHINLCARSRILAVSTLCNAVIVYRFRSKEAAGEIVKLDINFGTELASECDESPVEIFPPPLPAESQEVPAEPFLAKSISVNSISTGPSLITSVRKWSPGFQPEVVCQQIANDPVPSITCIALSSAYGIVSFGNFLGLTLVDYAQKKVIATMMTYELGAYGDISETPPDSAKLGRVMTPDIDTTDKPDCPESAKDKKKDRSSRFFGGSSDAKESKEHKERPKLAKKLSLRNGKEKDKEKDKEKEKDKQSKGGDREDGFFHRDIPMAGTVTSLMFTYTYTRKGANIIVPSLWIGTSTGNVSVIALSLPSNGEQRLIQPVIATNTGLQVNLKTSILSINFLDKNGCLYPTPFEFWKESDDSKTHLSTLPTFTIESTAKHHLILIGEKTIKIKVLPSFKTISKAKETDSSFFFIRADVIEIEGSSCLCCLTSIGSLRVYSLPSLRLIMDTDCGFSSSDYRIFRTFRFGKGGEAVYLTSPTEVQRIALTKRKQKEFIEGLGTLFTVVSTPEPRQKGFFQAFFSSTPSPIDREELFGVKNVGAASRGVADRVPGSGIEGLKNNSESVIGALAGARMALDERGQKLGVLEDRSAMMSERAQQFSNTARELAEKYQKKRWWQL